jgi:hypothetical protein
LVTDTFEAALPSSGTIDFIDGFAVEGTVVVVVITVVGLVVVDVVMTVVGTLVTVVLATVVVWVTEGVAAGVGFAVAELSVHPVIRTQAMRSAKNPKIMTGVLFMTIIEPVEY